jgi:hypothetical protein
MQLETYFFVTVIKSWVLRYCRKALTSSSSLGLGFMLGDGVANGFTDVAIENVDIGRPACIPGAIGGAKSPAWDPLVLPSMLSDITVLRGAIGMLGIIPYTLPVCWYGIAMGIWPYSEPVTEPGPPPNGMNGT